MNAGKIVGVKDPTRTFLADGEVVYLDGGRSSGKNYPRTLSVSPRRCNKVRRH